MDRLKLSVSFFVLLACLCLTGYISGCGHGGTYWDWKEDSVGLINYNFDICDASRDQRASACAYNSGRGDEYIVTWQDRRSGTDYDIFAVILNSYRGEPVSTEIHVCDSVDDQCVPSVAYNSVSDEYLIVWEDRRSGTDYDIFAQLLDGDGGFILANFAVSSVIGRDERAPRVVYNDVVDDYLVVWDEESASGDTDIMGQILDGDGTPIGSAFVICDYSGNQQSPAVAFNSTSDEYLIVWMDFRYYSFESDVFGQVIDKNGALVGGDFDVNADSGDQDFPAVAYNPDRDTYLVVWEDWRYSDPDIRAQELYSDGLPRGDFFDITWDTASQRNPSICYNTGESRYLVVWQDDWEGSLDIFAQKLDVDAYPLDDYARLSDEVATHIEPAVCANTEADEYLAVWSARLTANYDILGQLLY